MKGCIFAAAILLLVVIGVICNALYIRHTTDQLMEWVDALPEVPTPQETPRAIGQIRERLEKKVPLLGITVPYSIIDRVSEALINLEACARAGDRLQYTETLALLRDLVEEIGRTEKITVKNIL